MSVRVMGAVWQHARYAAGTLLVLLALADYSDDNGYCWPSVESLARKARLSPRQVHSILSRFKGDGIISVEKEGGGRGIANHYKIHVEKISVNSTSVKPTSLKPEAQTLKSTTSNPEIQRSAIRKNRQEPSIQPATRYRDLTTLYDGPEYQPGWSEVAS